MFGSIDPYHFPHDEAGSFYRTIYQGLIEFDEYEGEFIPVLAKSWKRVSPTVLEFELRDDVTFHNGNKFTADDVVATIDYISDPKTRIRFKNRYDWAKAEKPGPYKVRITAEEAFSTDLSALAYRFKMLDAETMKGLDKVSDYGRLTPVATGTYKEIGRAHV